MSIRGKIEAKFHPVSDKKVVVGPAKAPVVSNGIPGEVVAAISAAVAVICGEGAVVKGIRPVSRRAVASGRSAWNMAGLLDNTCPF